MCEEDCKRNMSNEKEASSEICLCAAIKTASGRIYPGRRHGHCAVSIYYLENEEEKKKTGQVQGFLTSKGRFVDRVEGLRLQKAAGIKSAAPEGYDRAIL